MTIILTAGTLSLVAGILTGLLWRTRREYRRATAALARPNDGPPLTDRDKRILASIEHHEQGPS